MEDQQEVLEVYKHTNKKKFITAYVKIYSKKLNNF